MKNSNFTVTKPAPEWLYPGVKTGVQIVPLHNQTSQFSPGTALYPKPDMVSNETIAAEVADTLGDLNGILLRGHGVVVVGRSVEEATVKPSIWREQLRSRSLLI